MQKTAKEGLKFRQHSENITYTITKIKGEYVHVKWDKGETTEHIDKVNRWINAPDWEIIYDTTERQTAEALLKEYNDFLFKGEYALQYPVEQQAITDFLTSKYGKG